MNRISSPPPLPVRRQGSALDRRRFLSLVAMAGGLPLLAPALAACGSAGGAAGGGATGGDLTQARSSVQRAAFTSDGLGTGSRIVSAFTGHVFARLAATDGNLVCSPYSMSLALAMTREGARGTTATEMDKVLGSTSSSELDLGLNAVTQTLAGRAGTRKNASGKDATIALEVACSLFGQTGVTWKQPFLDALAASYGAGVQLVDYQTAVEAARETINTWTSDHTARLIAELIPTGALDDSTRLVLVNALHLKAPWQRAFEKSQTSDQPFHRADGSTVTVPTMQSGTLVAASGRGDGWLGARLPYAGGELAMTVFLADAGREKELVTRLGADLGSVLAGFRESSGYVAMPRFSTRWGTTSVRPQLEALGMKTAFTGQADFSGMTQREQLLVHDVLHQAVITVDEEGTEAAAATAAIMDATAAQADPVNLVLDRPFLYVVHDVASGVPLFVGRVSDPSAS